MREPLKSSKGSPDNLKVWVVASSYLPKTGGLERVSSGLAKELQRRGYSVKVLTQRHPRTLPENEAIEGVSVQRLVFLIPRLHYLRNGRLLLFFASFIWFPLTLVRLLWQIANEQPQVVNLHFVGAPAIFLLLIRNILRFRFVVSLHGDDVEGLARGNRFDRWIFRATLRQADVVTACSRYLLDQAEVIEPSIRRKAQVIHNGMEIFPLAPIDQARDVILAVGRMVYKKGFDVLLRAFAQCRNIGTATRLTLIGDGPERNRLESLARDLGLEHRVEFAGLQNQDQVRDAMQASRLVVIPSRQEPFGMVALEAMAVGKPVVATRAGGLPEILKEADALLVEPDQPHMLAMAIENMWQRLNDNTALGSRNREIASHFSVERMVDQYAATYIDRSQAQKGQSD